MFSKACEYGIRATVFIASKSSKDERVNLKTIIKAIDSPEAFTAKVLQKLTKNKIIQSNKGVTSGFSIDKSVIKTLKISEIVLAIDGDSIYNKCGLGLEECNAKLPCPFHDQFAKTRNNLIKMLETTPVNELISGLEAKITFLKR